MIAVGFEPLLIYQLQERGFEITAYAELPKDVPDQVLLVSSDYLPSSELGNLRERYPNAQLLYAYRKRGVAGWQAIHAICERHQIHFLRPGISVEALVETLNMLLEKPEQQRRNNLIGVFGTLPGAGATRIAAALAQSIAKSGMKVILLGLNLFNPGWDGNTEVSLDAWRQRLIGRMLQTGDFEQLVSVQGIKYLPGNTDFLAALDYREEEVEHLLQAAQKAADVVIADFGAIPESAAWFSGMQHANFRLFVTHPMQTRTQRHLLQLARQVGVEAEHIFLCGNRVRSEDVSLQTMANQLGTQPGFSISHKGVALDFALSLSRSEQEDIQRFLEPILRTMGQEPAAPLKRRWL